MSKKMKKEMKSAPMNSENFVRKSSLAAKWDGAGRAVCVASHKVADYVRNLEWADKATLLAASGLLAGNVWAFSSFSPYLAVPCTMFSALFTYIFNKGLKKEIVNTISNTIGNAVFATVFSIAITGFTGLLPAQLLHHHNNPKPDDESALVAMDKQVAWKKGMPVKFEKDGRNYVGVIETVKKVTTEEKGVKDVDTVATLAVPYDHPVFWSGKVAHETLTVSATRKGDQGPAHPSTETVSPVTATQPATP